VCDDGHRWSRVDREQAFPIFSRFISPLHDEKRSRDSGTLDVVVRGIETNNNRHPPPDDCRRFETRNWSCRDEPEKQRRGSISLRPTIAGIRSLRDQSQKTLPFILHRTIETRINELQNRYLR